MLYNSMLESLLENLQSEETEIWGETSLVEDDYLHFWRKLV